ncbi:MAG: hypothetical protein ACT4QB_13915 [Gammaproteobacteria bacterium]
MSSHYTFVGGTFGPWEVASITPVRGEGLDPAARIEVVNARLDTLPRGASWALRGTTSNLRYTTRDEKERLAAIQPALGRSGASTSVKVIDKRPLLITNPLDRSA